MKYHVRSNNCCGNSTSTCRRHKPLWRFKMTLWWRNYDSKMSMIWRCCYSKLSLKWHWFEGYCDGKFDVVVTSKWHQNDVNLMLLRWLRKVVVVVIPLRRRIDGFYWEMISIRTSSWSDVGLTVNRSQFFFVPNSYSEADFMHGYIFSFSLYIFLLNFCTQKIIYRTFISKHLVSLKHSRI